MSEAASLPGFVLARHRALLSSDWQALEEMLDPALRYVHATGLRHNKDEYLAFAREALSVCAINLSSAEVQQLGDIAVVTGRLHQTIVRRGESAPVSVVSWVTEVWRGAARWQLVAFQSTRAT